MIPYEQPDIVPTSESPVSYELRTRWTFQIEVPWQDHPLVADIPNGFVYDGMSIPRAAASLVGLYPDGIHRAADLVHDFCYQHKGAVFGQTLTRLQCDDIHRLLYADAGGSAERIRTVYDAIRAFGWIFWNKLHLSQPDLDPRTATAAKLMAFTLQSGHDLS